MYEELPDGSINVASIGDRKKFWRDFFKFFPYTAKAAQELIGMHASTGPAERNWSAWRRLYFFFFFQKGITTKMLGTESGPCISKIAHYEINKPVCKW